MTAEALAAPLENYANKCAPAGQSLDQQASGDRWRVERWSARAVLWHESSLKRVHGCGRWSRLPDGSVGVRKVGTVAGYAGLVSCGSVWACPVCNARIQAVRRLEVGTALSWALGGGGGAAFGAYTLQHNRGSDLDVTWRALSKCWAGVTRDKSVRKVRGRLEALGLIRAAEVTHGEHGWHPHLHPLHLFRGRVPESAVQELHAAQLRAWIAAAERLGHFATPEAQHLHRVDGVRADQELGEYFTKATFRPSAEAVGWEMTSTQTKSRSRGAGSTPWDLLRSVYVDGDADSLTRWHEYEAGAWRKKAISWSRGLRRMVGLDQEQSDEDIAAQEVGSEADTGFVIDDWSPVRSRPVLGAQLLGVVSKGGWDEGRKFCADNGIRVRAGVS